MSYLFYTWIVLVAIVAGLSLLTLIVFTSALTNWLRTRGRKGP